MYPVSYSGTVGRPTEPSAERGLSPWDRAMVLVSGLVMVAGGLTALVAGLFGWEAGGLVRWWPPEQAVRYRVLAAGVGAGLALLGAAAMRPSLARPGAERAIVRSTGLGEVHISLKALQTLARRAASQVRGIQEAEVHVRPLSSGDVHIHVSLVVQPDESIPELCDEVQARVDQYLRQTAGVGCGQVNVWVRSVARSGRASRTD